MIGSLILFQGIGLSLVIRLLKIFLVLTDWLVGWHSFLPLVREQLSVSGFALDV